MTAHLQALPRCSWASNTWKSAVLGPWRLTGTMLALVLLFERDLVWLLLSDLLFPMISFSKFSKFSSGNYYRVKFTRILLIISSDKIGQIPNKFMHFSLKNCPGPNFLPLARDAVLTSFEYGFWLSSINLYFWAPFPCSILKPLRKN